MKTKEQELKILEKIEKLIQEAGGEESYIGKAFEGAVEDARENIKWDTWCSYVDRYSTKCAEADKMERYLDGLVSDKEREIIELEKAVEAASGTLQKELALANRNIEILKANEERITRERNEARAGEEWEKARADHAEMEVLKLKAKLYDLIQEEE